MKFCSLYSGSSGNSLFVGNHDTRLLVDAGLSGKRIEKALSDIDELPSTLSGILVTHEHSDHIQGVGILSRRYNLPIFANEATWCAMEKKLGNIKPQNVKIIQTDATFEVGSFSINPFDISHDAAHPVGYVLDDGHHTVGIATDTGIITDRILKALMPCQLVLLESNHDPEMLATGRYPYPLKQRIKGEYGHLSNETAAKAAITLTQQGVEHLLLGHLSQENNFPLLAFQTTECVLTEAGIAIDKDLTLAVAKRNSASSIYNL